MENPKLTKQLSSRRKTARFSIRASAIEKKIIERAAKLKETTISEFVLEQSLLAAQQVIADQAQFTLSKKQWDAFCAALDAPPKAIPALRKLLTEPGIFDGHS